MGRRIMGFFFQAEDGIRDVAVTGVQTCALPISTQPQTGDPVAEAARKAREQKKAAAKPKKVYTEDDIPSRGGEAASPAPATKPATAPEAAKNQAPNGQVASAG